MGGISSSSGMAADPHHQDSSRSVSPGGTWSSPYHLNSNSNSSNHAAAALREADRGRARQDGHSSGEYEAILHTRFFFFTVEFKPCIALRVSFILGFLVSDFEHRYLVGYSSLSRFELFALFLALIHETVN